MSKRATLILVFAISAVINFIVALVCCAFGAMTPAIIWGAACLACCIVVMATPLPKPNATHLLILMLLLAVPLMACNDGSNPNRPMSGSRETVKVSDFEVTPPEECVNVLDYYVLQMTRYSHPWDVVKCLDKDGRRSVFYKSFSKAEWNKRYLRGKMNAEANN